MMMIMMMMMMFKNLHRMQSVFGNLENAELEKKRFSQNRKFLLSFGKFPFDNNKIWK